MKVKLLTSGVSDSRFDSEPAYSFEIGERVDCGGFDEIYIEAIQENGLLYDLKCISHNKGKNVRTEIKNKTITTHRERVSWYDIKKYIELESVENLYKREDYWFSFMQQTVSSLLGYMYYGCAGTDMSPDYQRGFVWNEEKQHKLIDSIFNNVDIGKFVFIKLPYTTREANGYEILDGKQRLNTIKLFWEGRIKYKGKTINEISISDRSHFENTSVSVAQSRQLTKEQKYRYFLKLNTGEPISKDHLEKVKKLWLKELKK